MRLLLLSAAILFLSPWGGSVVLAYDINEKFSLSGVAAWAGQCQKLQSPYDNDDSCRGSLAWQPEINIRVAQAHTVFFKLGFAARNGLKDVGPFTVAPWAADLKNDVRDINGTSRDFLITAWYRYEKIFAGDSTLQVIAGLIDATEYLDQNRYANDEYSHFMNASLINGPNVILPSYAPGAAVQWRGRRLSAAGVYMNVGRPERGRFDFVGTQLGVHLETGLGQGNYRILLGGTSDEFRSSGDTSRERQLGLVLSLDQEFGEQVGGFLRLAGIDAQASANYSRIYAGGVNFKGTRWGRPADRLAFGLAYLDGGNNGIAHTRTAEIYYRISLGKGLAVTPDLQYMMDTLRAGEGPQGIILGVRVTFLY